jgi:hypothetical protein
MDTWNREEIYAEIWEQPLVKVAAKYGISAVMLGKVCHKLQIPLPGRGYWTKKEFGKPVQKIPLPAAKDLPVVQRLKELPSDGPQPPIPTPEPTDPEYQRILQIEARAVVVDPAATRHKLVLAAAKSLVHAEPDNRGVVQTRWNEACLDLRVSKNSIDRALNVINAVILLLEAEKFPVTIRSDRHGTSAQVFGQSVPFSIVEKTREKSRKEVKEYSYAHTVIEYQPSGELEFRAGDDHYGYRKVRDGKTQKLEGLISKLAGSVVREGRDRVIQAEKWRLEEIERKERARKSFARRANCRRREKSSRFGILSKQLGTRAKDARVHRCVREALGNRRARSFAWISKETTNCLDETAGGSARPTC